MEIVNYKGNTYALVWTGLKPTQLEIEVGKLWNEGKSLKHAVFTLGEEHKNKIVWYWKKFYNCKDHKGKVNHIYKTRINVKDELRMNHYGLIKS